MTITRPSPSEHAPFASTYIDATATALEVMGTDQLWSLLVAQPMALVALLEAVDPALVDFAYAPGKWTLGESLVHVSDTERVFAYRLMRVARGDMTPLPGFDQDAWVPESRTTGRPLADILTEIQTVRAATLSLAKSLDEKAWGQVGVASGHPISPRALAWMIAGHFAHHLDLTRDRYLAR
jgi:hypothetical protein